MSNPTTADILRLPDNPQKRAIRLTLPYPPSVNNMYPVVRGRMILSAEGRRYKAEAARMARNVGAEPLSGPVSVTLRFFRPRKAGDLDNAMKGPLDSLKGVAFVDDSQVVRIDAERFEDKANPRVEVTVAPAAPAQGQGVARA